MYIDQRNHPHHDSPLGRRSVERARFEASFPIGLIALLISLALLSFTLLPTSQCLGQVIMREDLVYPLIENEPFDLLTLDKSNKNAVVRILPPENLKLPLPDRGDLIFEFAEDSELPLEVPYSAIVKYETFSDLLLAEANMMMNKGDLSRAFRNLLYVYDHGGKSRSEVSETLRACLFLDGREKFESGKYEISLSIFEDIYQEKPNFKVPGINKPLISIVLACYDGILKKKLELGQYKSIRLSLQNVERRYGSDAKQLVETWKARFISSADDFLKEALALAEQGKGREAHLKAKQADRIIPGRKKTEEVQAEILAKFPLVVVGVSQVGGKMDPGSLDHWGSRRVGRLIQRSLVEITGLADEGAKYEFLNGTISRIDNIGLKYAFELDAESSQMVPEISAFQLASRLLAFANPVNDFYNETWAKILETVEIQSETRVVITLQRPFVRPEALMQIPYPTPRANPDADARDPMSIQNGLFKLVSSEEQFSFFGANESYLDSNSGKHPVVIEQSFKTDTDAVDALLKGDVDVVDRIPPADYRRLKDIEAIQVRPYVIPTVHLLVPKIRGNLEKSYRFRNALSTAIDRDSIVNEVITNGEEIDGCGPLSGPFPLGGDDNDQISYGYDLRVKPLRHNERMAMALTEIAIKQEMPKKGSNQQSLDDLGGSGDGRPALVLVHQNSSLVSNCAAAIARSWTAAGIPTTLRALPPGVTYPEDSQWDVLYTELFIEEPVVDAIRMLGRNGFADQISAPVEQSLRRLVTSQTWQGACVALRNIHRQIAVDLSVIPLYQVKEHFAFRDNVYDVGRDLVHLYQYVDRWKVETAAQAKLRKQLLESQ